MDEVTVIYFEGRVYEVNFNDNTIYNKVKTYKITRTSDGWALLKDNGLYIYLTFSPLIEEAYINWTIKKEVYVNWCVERAILA